MFYIISYSIQRPHNTTLVSSEPWRCHLKFWFTFSLWWLEAEAVQHRGYCINRGASSGEISHKLNAIHHIDSIDCTNHHDDPTIGSKNNCMQKSCFLINMRLFCSYNACTVSIWGIFNDVHESYVTLWRHKCCHDFWDPLTLQRNQQSVLISNVTVFVRITHPEVDNTSMLLDVPILFFPQLMHLSLWGSSNILGTNILALVMKIVSHPTVQVVVFCVKHHTQFADVLDQHNLNGTCIMLATLRQYLWDDLGCSCMLFWELVQEKATLCEPNHSTSHLSIKI